MGGIATSATALAATTRIAVGLGVMPAVFRNAVAAAMEIEAEVKQELLELRSTSERLERLRAMLAIAVKGYEERARIHELAKGNGHGGKRIELE